MYQTAVERGEIMRPINRNHCRKSYRNTKKTGVIRVVLLQAGKDAGKML
jgi:hypothetical protein